MVDETTPESNNSGRPSESLILLVGASASACEDACQIIPDDQENRRVRQKYGSFEVILEYSTEQSLIGIWTLNVELARVATESFCPCGPSHSLAAPNLHYELARRLQCHALELEVTLEAAARIRCDLPRDEKHVLEDLEREQTSTRETLTDVQCSLSCEDRQKLKQQEQIHKLTSCKDGNILA